MSSKLEYIYPGGILKTIITSVTLVNNVAFQILQTVPAGRRRILLGVRMVNCDSVARVLRMDLYNEAALTNLIKALEYVSIATTAALQWPDFRSNNTAPDMSPMDHLVILDPGHTLALTWAAGGASAGGGPDADGCVVQYLEVPIA